MTTLNATQVGLEVWSKNPSKALGTQVGLEVWSVGTAKLQPSQVALELWRTPGTASRSMAASQVAIEAWYPPTFGLFSQVGIEAWTTVTNAGGGIPPVFWFIE